MRIRFWGTRGSFAKPGPTTVRYGGNTSCVEVRPSDDTLIVLDCGTGAHGLGQSLAASTSGPLHGHLLITHTHWDHIQGFPFFAPLFVAGNEWDVYAPQGLGQRLEATLAGQMQYPYFPVTLEQLGATVRYHELVEGAFTVGPVRVTAQYVNHPALTFGYRFEIGGVTLVYATDHEPHSLHQPEPGRGRLDPTRTRVHREDERHIAFLAGADLVIHDGQYTLDDYPRHVGWGHCPAELAVDFAVAARAKRLALFHHEPTRDDHALDRLVDQCRRRAGRSDLKVFGAAEGQVVELEERLPRNAAPPATRTTAQRPRGEPGATTILVVDDEPNIVTLLIRTLESEGFRLLAAADGEAALDMARTERPDLVLLDWKLPGRDGLDVCRQLRADTDPRVRDIPVVLLTGKTGADDTAEGFAAGVTDYVTKPFKPTYIRSRVHAWLVRTGSGQAISD